MNVSSKRQVECLPVDDNDDESLEDNGESDEDGSGPPSDEEEDGHHLNLVLVLRAQNMGAMGARLMCPPNGH